MSSGSVRVYRAPGKVVLSGAYAVLRGSPAIVSAADRYAEASSERPADFECLEVVTARQLGFIDALPTFDASALRQGGRKLGLGSSAAILTASLCAAGSYLPDAGPNELARLFTDAYQAHRQAQGGGSGVDVAAAVYGGTFSYQLGAQQPRIEPVALPPSVHVEVWGSQAAASTADFLRQVRATEEAQPKAGSACFHALDVASRAAVKACHAQDGPGFIRALEAQLQTFMELGTLAGIPICTAGLQQVNAELEGSALFFPAGAGGGDISIWIGDAAPNERQRAKLEASGHHALNLNLAAPGVHSVAPPL